MLAEVKNIDQYMQSARMGRHETFTPRYGWLKKCYDAVQSDPGVFKAIDAIEKLGVGKNMVRSIRYWGQAFKIIKEDKGLAQSTPFGDWLLGDKGKDPYLEDIASLWLLHWNLFIPELEAVNWVFAFNRNHFSSFNNKELTQTLINTSKKYPHLENLSEKSFGRDASCILRMYVTGDSKSEIDCPFTQLEIIRRAEEKHQFYFDYSSKPSLPPLIYAAACFSYIDKYAASSQKAISLNRLTFDFNSPGVVFKLSETASGENLRMAAEKMSGFSLVEQTGGIQIHLEHTPKELFADALETYYKEQ